MMTPAVSPLNSAGGGNILGFNIGSNQVLAVYGSLSGLVFEKISLPTSREGGFAQLSETLVQMADRLLTITQAQHLPTPDRVSICVSADIENTTGEIVASEDFPEWKHVPIRSQLASRFNLPVYLEESANAGALAEVYFGQGQSRRNVVFINLTPTVRAGIFSEGRIFRGQGGSAGKVGSFKQKMESAAHEEKDSSLNVLASASGMLRLALCRHSGHWPEDVALLDVINGAIEGDPFAVEVFQESGRALGEALAPLTHLLGPEVIIIGYPGCLLGEVLLAPLRDALQQESGLSGDALPLLAASGLGARLPELQAIAAAVHAAKGGT